MRWCVVALLVVGFAAIFAGRNAIQIQYHTFVLGLADGEMYRGIAGKPPTLVGRVVGPRQMADMREHHLKKLVELGAIQHRLYFFPRIKPSTEANQWLSHEFREKQKQLSRVMRSASGGTRNKLTGKRVRSIELWLDSSADVSQWDAWKESVDETELEMMQLEKDE